MNKQLNSIAIAINPLQPGVPYLYPLKTSENHLYPMKIQRTVTG